MNNARFFDWLGSAALTLAIVSVLLLFVPGLVRADEVCNKGVTAPLDGFLICDADTSRPE